MRITKVDVKTKVIVPKAPKGKTGRAVERFGSAVCVVFWATVGIGVLALVAQALLS